MAQGGVILELEGFDALKRAFRELEPKLAKKVIRQAVRAGMKTIQAAAKAEAPVRTGAGRRGIRIRTSKGPRGSRVRYTIALATLVGDAKGPTWYMWLQEFGYTLGKRLRQGGKTIGYAATKVVPVPRKMPGRHFMRKAMREREASVKQQIIENILLGIEREAKA